MFRGKWWLRAMVWIMLIAMLLSTVLFALQGMF